MKRKSLTNNVRLVHFLCSVVFTAFVFLFLYFYKANSLVVAQNYFSEQQTHYDPLIGAIVVTFLLSLLHVLIHSATKLHNKFYFLNFFPSLLLLTWLTDVDFSTIDPNARLSNWIFVVPILLVLYVIAIVFAKQYQEIENSSAKVDYFVELLWKNMLMLSLMFLFVGVFSNGDAVFLRQSNRDAKLIHYEFKKKQEAKAALGADSLEAEEK